MRHSPLSFLASLAVFAATPVFAQNVINLSGTMTEAEDSAREPFWNSNIYGADPLEVILQDKAGFNAVMNGPAPHPYMIIWFYAAGETNYGDSDAEGAARISSVPFDQTNVYGDISRLTEGESYRMILSSGYSYLEGAYDVTITGFCISPCTPPGPSEGEELAAVLSGNEVLGRQVVILARSLTHRAIAESLATRDQAIVLSAANSTRDQDVIISTRGQGGLANGLYVWAEAGGFETTSTADSAVFAKGATLSVGADFEVAPNMIVGVALGVSDLQSDVGTFQQDGRMTYFQPYFGYRSDAVLVDASATFGFGSLDQTSDGGAGSADTKLQAVSIEVGRAYDVGRGYQVTPSVGATFGSQSIEGESGTLVGEGDVGFTQSFVGAELARSAGFGDFTVGLYGEHLAVDGDVDASSFALLEEGWSGRVSFGGNFELSEGVVLGASLDLAGLGTEARATSASLQIAKQF